MIAPSLRHTGQRFRASRDERGSVAIETLIMTTAAIALVIVVVAAGRYVDGSAQANDAPTPPPGRLLCSRVRGVR